MRRVGLMGSMVASVVVLVCLSGGVEASAAPFGRGLYTLLTEPATTVRTFDVGTTSAVVAGVRPGTVYQR